MQKTNRRRTKLVLVLGGASSGKSQAALDLAGKVAPKAFVATGQALDREMAERIRRHQCMRSPDWETVEVPVDLAGWFRKQGREYRAIVVDCLTLWLSNLGETGVRDDAMNEQVADLLRAIRGTRALVLLVSNELGLGLVPLGRSARRFRDMAGKVNQRIAAEADEVYFIVSGQTLRLK
ncbi:MAG TPA: bifunctional adenosylcobinamide kinase/adenosylcobinamide-phosphate guanylyltransferase [Nitrospiraceae bacterium]|nr:bifunctional adenosylcobinamide kinase/adenosylcobinamide-phosphate guanylyltransferase [Nitrospiraceae bacterium]